MSDDHYPFIDYIYLESLLEKSPKVIDSITVGSTRAFVLEGTAPSHKRTLYLRRTADGQIPYYKATGIAIRIGCLGELSSWYEINKNWKDGAYIVSPPDGNSSI